jgi:hypothetical protein
MEHLRSASNEPLYGVLDNHDTIVEDLEFEWARRKAGLTSTTNANLITASSPTSPYPSRALRSYQAVSTSRKLPNLICYSLSAW